MKREFDHLPWETVRGQQQQHPTPEEITRHGAEEVPAGENPWVGEYRPETGIEVVAYDPGWPKAYDAVATAIRSALETRALSVEHVGSTAVPGLAAKPVIDVDLAVADPAGESDWLPELEAAGFVLVAREPWWQEHRALRCREPRANVHVFGPEAAELVRHRIFRDWLREQPEDRDAYAAAKTEAAQAANAAGEHSMDYNARKTPVVRAVYDRAFRAAGLL